MHIHYVTKMAVACCVLHNVCEIHGETFNEEWTEEVESLHLQRPCDTVASQECEHEDAEAKGQLTVLAAMFEHFIMHMHNHYDVLPI